MGAKEKSTTPQGIIYAIPEDMSSNVSLGKVLGMSAFLNAPENRDKVQFWNGETSMPGSICPGATQPLNSGGTARAMI